jgi:hypothetical protein
MIYGFTGVTNFEELAKIFTGYKITLFGVLNLVVSLWAHIQKKKLLKKLFRKY